MAVNDIGVNIHTLPLVTVGVGFGIDYGLYIVSRIIEEIRVRGDLDGLGARGARDVRQGGDVHGRDDDHQHRLLDDVAHPVQRRDGPAAGDLDGHQLRRVADAARRC